MDVEPQRVKALQQIAKGIINTLRHKHRHTRADADDFYMRDFPQGGQHPLQHLRRHGQRVAAGNKHITDLRCAPDVFQLGIKITAGNGLMRVADQA